MKPKRKITYDRPTCPSFICVEKIWYGRLQTNGYSTEPGANFEKLNEDKVVVKLKEFQSVIGSLMDALIGTIPDISTVVGVLRQHMSKSGKQHWLGVKRVLIYIKGTLGYGLQYKAINVDEIKSTSS